MATEDESSYVDTKWSNDSWSISWLNDDEIIIEGPYKQSAKLAGGDFEGILSALCACKNADKGLLV